LGILRLSRVEDIRGQGKKNKRGTKGEGGAEATG